MRASFSSLRERLLAGGVGRRPARRYIAELKDHLDDLIAEERRTVSDPYEAERRALSRLGSFEMLGKAMIERREFQAWSRKAPFAAYLLAPVLALAVGTAVAAAAVVMTAKSLRSGPNAELPQWLTPVAEGVVVFSHALLPMMLAWALGVIAIRHRTPWLWPLCGIVLLALLGSTIHLGLTLPSPTAHGEVGLSANVGNSSAQIFGFARNLTLALAPYVGLRLWQSKRDRQGA